jgi:hypothetical protein
MIRTGSLEVMCAVIEGGKDRHELLGPQKLKGVWLKRQHDGRTAHSVSPAAQRGEECGMATMNAVKVANRHSAASTGRRRCVLPGKDVNGHTSVRRSSQDMMRIGATAVQRRRRSINRADAEASASSSWQQRW